MFPSEIGWVDYHISLAMGLRPRAVPRAARGAPLLKPINAQVLREPRGVAGLLEKKAKESVKHYYGRVLSIDPRKKKKKGSF